MVATEPDAGRWGHVPALDGVRGVAVIVVLLFHGGVSWARGGFLGVDAFFVLSGLLITSLLLDEAATTGAVDLGRFWARRARRLLPALLAVVAAAAAYGAWLAPRGSLEGLRKDAIATLFYVANWRFIQAGADYFESTAAPSVLRHTWSLAIEEQFYVVWPLVTFGLARLASRRLWVGAVAALGAIVSAVAMAIVFDPEAGVSRAYFGTDTRVHVVLTGCVLASILAALRTRTTPVPSSVARALGAAASVAGVGFLAAVALVEGTDPLLFRGGFIVVALAVASVLAHIVLVPMGWSARLLAWSPLRIAGVVSYGLYLWHWPVYLTLTRARTGLEMPWLLVVRLVVTAALAAVSYVVIERPIRRGALPGVRALVALSLATGVVAAAVIVGTRLPPLPDPPAAAPRTASGYPASTRPARSAGEPARVLIVGDSVGKTVADRLARTAAKEGLAFTNRAVLGCGVVRGGPYRYFGSEHPNRRECDGWPQQWREHVSQHDPDVVLVVLGRWEVMDRMHGGRWTQLGDPAFDAYIESEIERSVSVLTAGSATVAFTTAPYYFRGERPDGGRWPEDDPARVNRFNEILRKVADRHASRVAILDLNGLTSRGGVYTPVIDGVSLRYDGVHFSPAGATWMGPWLIGALLEMSPPESGRGGRSNTTTPPPVAPTPPGPTRTSRPPSASTTAPPTTEPPPSTTVTTEPPPPPSTTLTPLPTLPSG